MWAWSRRPENISFTPEAAQLILENAAKMGKKYSSRIPLVEPADQRLKLARLSIAAAICVYSTDEGTNVVVKEEHVKFVIGYLNAVYDSKALGYDRFSADEFENSDTTDTSLQRSASISLVYRSQAGQLWRLSKLFISFPTSTEIR